jgi:hypothetical protein
MDIPKAVLQKYLPDSLCSVIRILDYPSPNIDFDRSDIPVDGILCTLPSFLEGQDATSINLTVDSIVIPPIKFIEDLRNIMAEKQGYQSFEYVSNGTTMRLPFWVLNLWMEQHTLVYAQVTWQKAVQWTAGLPAAREWKALMDRLPWQYDLPRAMGGSVGIRFLAKFCSTDWLSTLHVDQMAAVVDDRLGQTFQGYRFVGTAWSDTLRNFHQLRRDEYLCSSSSQFLRNLGEEVKGGNIHCIAAIISVFQSPNQRAVLPTTSQPRGNHWVALILDLDEGVVRHGDPAGAGIDAPSKLLDMIKWWLAQHGWKNDISIVALPCAQQQDGHSCSTLAFNAIVSHFYPSTALVSPTAESAPGRFQALKLVSSYIQELVVSLVIY